MLQQFSNWVINNPAIFSQLVLSGALVLVTIAYTVFTKWQTDEMELTRKVSNQPVVKGGLGLMGPVNLILLIQNTGNSPAHNVNGEFYFEDIDIEPFEFHIPILSTGEEYEFGLPEEGGEEGGFLLNFGQIQDLIEEHDSDGILIVETEFENPFGEEYETKTELDLTSFMDNKSHIIRDGEEEKIRKAIEGIDSSLGDAVDQINSGPRSENADHQLYTTVLDILQERESTQFDAIHYTTGISQSKLYDIIDDLEKAGLVETTEDLHPMFNPETEITYKGEIEVDGSGAGDVEVSRIFDSLESGEDSDGTEEDSEAETEKE